MCSDYFPTAEFSLKFKINYWTSKIVFDGKNGLGCYVFCFCFVFYFYFLFFVFLLFLFFALFKSIFWRNRTLSNARWFYGKTRKIGKGNLYLIEPRLNEIWCAADNHKYMCHICAKGFLDSKFNQTVIDKNIKFSRNCPKFHIFTKIVIF